MKNTINLIIFAFSLLLASCNDDANETVGPVKVHTIGAAEVYSDMAVLLGSVDRASGVEVAEKGFFLSADRVDRNHPAGTKITVQNDGFRAEADGLTPLTEYCILAYAVDAAGKTYYGYPVMFTTTKVTEIRFTPLSVTEKTAKTAVLYATIDEDSDIPASWFGLKYWVAGAGEPTDDDPSVIYVSGAPTYLVSKGESFCIALEGLTKNTSYNARMFAQNDSQGVFSPVFTFSTHPITTPVVQTGEAIDPDQTSVTISNSKMVSNGNDPDATFGIYYMEGADRNTQPDPDTWIRVEATQIDTEGFFTVPVADLTPGSSYGLSAFVQNDDYFAFGEVLEVSTGVAQPPLAEVVYPTPDDFGTIIEGTSDSRIGFEHIYFEGKAKETGGSPIEEYGFYYSTDPELTDATRIVSSNMGPDETFSVKVGGLTAATRYYYAAFVKSALAEKRSEIHSLSTAIDGGWLLEIDVPGNGTTGATFKNSTTPLVYHELPPVVTTTASYYFLDRNLGATKMATAVQTPVADIAAANKEYIGYYFKFGISTPVSSQDAFDLKLLGQLANTDYGWYTTGGTDWVNNNPCPAGYRLPTKTELEDVIAVLPTDANEFRYRLRLCTTCLRNANVGGLGDQNAKQAATCWTSTQPTILNTVSTGFIGTSNPASGVPVRCVSVVPNE